MIDNNCFWDNYYSAAQKDGRGNICPTTIILPTLAMEAKEKGTIDVVETFFEILNEAIEDAKDGLIERFEYIASQSPNSAKFMYDNRVMAGYVPELGIRSALRHGTLALGMIGAAETAQILVGSNQLSKDGFDLIERICKLYDKKCAEYKEKYKLNFGVYFTPKICWAI